MIVCTIFAAKINVFASFLSFLHADYYRNSVYHPDAHYLIVDYLEIASVCHKITTSDWFNNTIIFVIFIAGLNVGVQTYDLSEGASNFFSGLDIFILTTFIVEFVLKVVAEGLRPWYYWASVFRAIRRIRVIARLIRRGC